MHSFVENILSVSLPYWIDNCLVNYQEPNELELKLFRLGKFVLTTSPKYLQREDIRR